MGWVAEDCGMEEVDFEAGFWRTGVPQGKEGYLEKSHWEINEWACFQHMQCKGMDGTLVGVFRR